MGDQLRLERETVNIGAVCDHTLRLDWMLVLGGVMATERLAPWRHRLAWLVGLVLIVWATFWVIALPHSSLSHP